jgi:alkylhydroperoxidase family enzyme
MPPSFSDLQAATRHAVVDGPGSTDSTLRRQAASGQPPPELTALVQKIRDHAYKVTDDDMDALRARYSEDQLFELVVAAAVGAAEYRLQAALAALEDA